MAVDVAPALALAVKVAVAVFGGGRGRPNCCSSGGGGGRGRSTMYADIPCITFVCIVVMHLWDRPTTNKQPRRFPKANLRVADNGGPCEPMPKIAERR